MGVDREIYEKKINLNAMLEATLQSMPTNTVLLIEFTQPDYRIPVIAAVAQKHNIQLINIDNTTDKISYTERKSAPIFIDIRKWDSGAKYGTWLNGMTKKHTHPIVIFCPYESKASHEWFDKYAQPTSFAIDKRV